MEKPKVSVIIPVYNTEIYLDEAIGSITNQSLKNIEIIVVNDGSTDNSLQVINNLADKDDRIKVYSQKNQGLSKTRNAAMKKATGEYIYFMDSDDILDANTLQACYEKCKQNDLDFVFFDADAFISNVNESLNDYYHRDKYVDANRVYSGCEIMDYLMTISLYRSAACFVFVKKDLLEKLNLTFYPGIIHEDELFTAMLHLNAQRVAYLPYRFFKRRIRESSITGSRFGFRNIDSYFIVLSELLKYAQNEGKQYAEIIDRICTYIINPVIYRASDLPFNNRIKVLKLSVKHNFIKYITLKNRIILLFPFTIKMKSILKK